MDKKTASPKGRFFVFYIVQLINEELSPDRRFFDKIKYYDN